jgi:hypothetical protein
MPRITTLQTAFNSGVLDPRLAARTDLKHFYQGAATGENVVSIPQGGLTRRSGMQYVATLSSTARLAAFAFNVEQTYLMVFTNNNIAVYKDDVFQVNVTTTYTTAQLFELQWTQSADTMIIVHKDHQPATLVRGSSHTSWTLADITFSEYPTFDFEQDYDSITFIIGGGSDDATTAGNSISITANSSFFTSADVGGWFEGGKGDNFGKGRITAVVTATICTLEVVKGWVDPSLSGNATNGFSVSGSDASIQEVVWSTARGWPKSVTFHEGRLWFGGSLSRPQTLWGSVTNDFYNFDYGIGLDDEGIDISLDTDMVNAITNVFSGRHLQVFTTGGEFFMPDSPITPSKSAVKRQTLHGSGSVPPQSIDGATFFLDRTGKALREFLFTYTESSYTSGTISLLASHLLNAPVDMAVLRGTSSSDANYLCLVNGDGTVAVFNTLRQQEVGGWTHWTTTGTVEAVAVVVETVYFLVKRTINGVETRFLEKYGGYTDCGVTQTLSPASATVTGLAHLNGQSCRVRADGAVMENATPSGGSITLSRVATEVEVGLDFNITIKTMPLNKDFLSGPILTRRKRIVRVIADLYETLGISVNGTALPDRSFGEGILDDPPAPFTGIKEVFLLGWDDLAQVTITQTDPMPMTVLGLAIEVET